MTLPKKGFRPITVDETVYKYKITGEDEGIRFIIGIPEIKGQVLIGFISYHSIWVSNFNEQGIAKSWSLYQRTIVTPKTIREIILYGLANNWKPKEDLKQLYIGDIDENIDLQLKKTAGFPNLNESEVVAVFENQKKVLDTDFEPYNGEGNIYHKFGNIQLAKDFTESKINEDINLSCWILKDFNTALMFIDQKKATEFKINVS